MMGEIGILRARYKRIFQALGYKMPEIKKENGKFLIKIPDSVPLNLFEKESGIVFYNKEGRL